jgi:hypothetical protein
VVKSLLKILLVGFAAFMTLAIADEWSYFTSAWFGEEQSQAPELPEEEQKAAADAVYLTLSLMRHLYASGGDPRFAERMPAGEGLVEEMMADIDYLARNRRLQNPELLRLEVLSIEPLGEDRVEIASREEWRFALSHATGAEAVPPRSQTLQAKYLVVRSAQGWRVEGWEMLESGDELGEDDP